MRDKFIRFMQGRYGVDQFSRFLLGVALVSIIISIFTRGYLGNLLNTIGLLAIVYTYFRIFSRNIQKRYAENQKMCIRDREGRGNNLIQITTYKKSVL